MLRIGVSRPVELRIGVSGWQFRTSTDVEEERNRLTESGFADMSAGLKAAFVEQRGARPAVSLLAEVNVPIGSNGFTDGYVNPKAWLLFTNSLSDRLGLTYNLGPRLTILKREVGSTRSITGLDYAVALAGTATESAWLFAELFGNLPLSGDLPDRHTLQLGGAVLPSRITQLDARVGIGLVSAAPDWLVGFGFSIRLPG